MFIMDEDWTKKNNSEEPQDFANGGSNHAVSNTNGTGAYMLVSRAPDSKTVLKANPAYWGKGQFPLEVTEIIYTPIKAAATRVAALLSGEVDIIQDVPVQDLARVKSDGKLKVVTAPQNRTIFFGMNVGDADLKTDDVDGKNPFADVRVRRSGQHRDQPRRDPEGRDARPVSADRRDHAAVRQRLDQGTRRLSGTRCRESQERSSRRPATATASRSRSTARTTATSTTRRSVRPSTGMLGKIGIKVTLDSKPKAQHFPLIKNKETDFYMLGWGVPTFDSEYIFNFLVHTTTDKLGSWNGTRYSNPELDEKIQALAKRRMLDKRNAMIAEIWAKVQEEHLYAPDPPSGPELGHEERDRLPGAAGTISRTSSSSSSPVVTSLAGAGPPTGGTRLSARSPRAHPDCIDPMPGIRSRPDLRTTDPARTPA
jgi:peptide/nickel transport system substrate-binding protein